MNACILSGAAESNYPDLVAGTFFFFFFQTSSGLGDVLLLSFLPEGAMPSIITLHEAKAHRSRIVVEVAAGREVIIAKAGRAVAKLVPSSRWRGRSLFRLAGYG